MPLGTGAPGLLGPPGEAGGLLKDEPGERQGVGEDSDGQPPSVFCAAVT